MQCIVFLMCYSVSVPIKQITFISICYWFKFNITSITDIRARLMRKLFTFLCSTAATFYTNVEADISGSIFLSGWALYAESKIYDDTDLYWLYTTACHYPVSIQFNADNDESVTASFLLLKLTYTNIQVKSARGMLFLNLLTHSFIFSRSGLSMISW